MTASDRRLEAPHTVVDRALASAGPGGCVVIVEDTTETDLRFAVNTITTNGLRRHRRVTAVRMSDHADGVSVGIASRSGAVDIDDLLAAADADARDSAPAQDAAPLLSGTPCADFEQAPTPTEPSVLGNVLSGLGGLFERAAAAERVIAGFAEHSISTTYVGVSTGLRLRHVQPTGKVEVVMRDSTGTRSAWSGFGTTDFSDYDIGMVEKRLSERIDWGRVQVELPAGRYEVLMPPDAVADLVIMLGEAASGRDAEDGRSVFSAPGGKTRLGERIAEMAFDLRGDPRYPGLECMPFLVTTASGTDVSVFDNGLPLEETHWLRSGTLERLQYHRAGAARSGQPPTAPIDNLILEVPGAQDTLDQLISRTDRGLLLTCLWYIRSVDPSTLLLTGLTRDGVYLVERGEIVGTVNNFRFNQSPVDLLANSTEVGRTERALSREWNEWFNRTAMPALRVEGFNMSSVSPAT
jgi:predicted Zn-dependent protease